MKKIGVLKTYILFNAMKRHWNTTSYDFVKFKGSMPNLTRITLDRCPEKHFYKNLNKKYQTDFALISFLIPCFLDNPKISLHDFFTDEYKKLADDWFWKIKRLKSTFYDDVYQICLFIKQEKISFDYFFCSDLIYKALMSESIQIETFIILNLLLKFLDKYNCNDIIYSNMFEMRVKKYGSFISIDSEEYKKLLKQAIMKSKEAIYVNSTIVI